MDHNFCEIVTTSFLGLSLPTVKWATFAKSVTGTKIIYIIIHSTHYLFSDWPKVYPEFSKSAPGTSSRHLASDYTITPPSTLIILDITKTSPNNCLIMGNYRLRIANYDTMEQRDDIMRNSVCSHLVTECFSDL